jgi:hypothetical protein
MRENLSPATREIAGCFLMLILGAFLTIGLLRMLAVAGELARGNPTEWWRFLLWVVTPSAGSSCGFRGCADDPFWRPRS